MENRQTNEYMQALFDKMKACQEVGRIVSFRIVDISSRGFQVKVGGLPAFVPFRFMPWRYTDKAAWEVVFPYIKDTIFFCKIDRIETAPPRLFLDPSVHSFQPPAFEEGNAYEALVVFRSSYGVFLDLGFHFDWSSGSHVGLLHVSDLKKRGLELAAIQPGDRLWVTYCGIDKEGRIQLEKRREASRPAATIDESLLGQVLPVKVQWDETDGKNHFWAPENIAGKMPVTRHLYDAGPAMKRAIREALRQLPDGYIIHCEVTAISRKRGGSLLLRWVASDWPGLGKQSVNPAEAGT